MRRLGAFLTSLASRILRAIGGLGGRAEHETRHPGPPPGAPVPPPPAQRPPGALRSPPGAPSRRPPRDAAPWGAPGPPRAASSPPQHPLERREVARNRAARYANLWLTDPATGHALDPSRPLEPMSACELHLSLGALDPRSQVAGARRFPDELLPDADVELEVVVASTRFEVEPDRGFAPGIARAYLVLPGDGGPARDRDGNTELSFALRVPGSPGPARLRVAYYFRNAVVQSQVLDAWVGAGPGFRIETDFTATTLLRGLTAISDRRRMAMLVNSDVAGNHQILLRPPDGSPGTPRTFEIDHDQLAEPLDQLRAYLESEQGRPRQRQQTKQQLIRALQQVAPPGARLHDKLFVQARDVLAALVRSGPGTIIHVTKAATSQFTLPWAFLYEFPLPADAKPDRIRVCDLVRNWDERSSMVESGQRRCPHEHQPWHREEPVLCPFGFWGFRYEIEILTSSDAVVNGIPLARGSSIVALSTRRGVDQRQLSTHLDALSAALRASGVLGRDEVTSVADARRVLHADIPIIYFYCHGTSSGGTATVLSIGDGERLPPDLFTQWAKTWLHMSPLYWDKVRPLVFINACHSLRIEPSTMLSYVEAFVGGGGAAGVIGTEASVHAGLAADAALVFFTTLAARQEGRPSGTVADALHAVRAHYLAAGNLFGLLYSPYCWADLHLMAN